MEVWNGGQHAVLLKALLPGTLLPFSLTLITTEAFEQGRLWFLSRSPWYLHGCAVKIMDTTSPEALEKVDANGLLASPRSLIGIL